MNDAGALLAHSPDHQLADRGDDRRQRRRMSLMDTGLGVEGTSKDAGTSAQHCLVSR